MINILSTLLPVTNNIQGTLSKLHLWLPNAMVIITVYEFWGLIAINIQGLALSYIENVARRSCTAISMDGIRMNCQLPFSINKTSLRSKVVKFFGTVAEATNMSDNLNCYAW